MSKKQTDIDWRYRVVTTIAEDSAWPDGTVYKKGTPISVTTFIKHGNQELAIGDPSAPALFLSQSHQAYKNAIEIHPFVKGTPSGEENAVSEIVYDYLEYISAAIIFVYTALEAFANEEIPNSFTYETAKPSSKILVAHGKRSIERYVSLNEKLATVLPKAMGKSSPKGLVIWGEYVNLRRLRDRIIHLKSEDKPHSKADNLHPDSIWGELLAPQQPNFPLIAKKMIMHFRDEDRTHWLKYCPF